MKTVIVLIWRIASWKDYAWDFLEKKLWYKSLGISSGLRIIAQERWIEETRENLIHIGKELTTVYGDWYLAEILIKNNSEEVLIITWPRQLGQLEFLRHNTKSLFIGIEADAKIRYDRMKYRWKIGEDISYQRFLEQEQMEEEANQSVTKCLKQCDIIIENNGTLEKFEKEILKISKKFLWKNHLKYS